MAEHLDRRAFLQRAAALIPIMHTGALLPFPTAMAPSQTPTVGNTRAGRFARLQLRSAKLEECKTFYRDVLDLPVNMADERHLLVTCGQTVIEFTQTAASTQPYYHVAFNIPHNKLEAALQWIQPRCPVVPRSDGELVYHFPRWDAHAFYFLDPAGSILEFIARHTLKNDAPGDFSWRDVLCASEIGVVTPDVKTTAANLKRALALDYYVFASEGFAPIGDEHGLFIVVKQGRRWFGGDREAGNFEATATLRGAPDATALRLAESQFEVVSANP